MTYYLQTFIITPDRRKIWFDLTWGTKAHCEKREKRVKQMKLSHPTRITTRSAARKG